MVVEPVAPLAGLVVEAVGPVAPVTGADVDVGLGGDVLVGLGAVAVVVVSFGGAVVGVTVEAA